MHKLFAIAAIALAAQPAQAACRQRFAVAAHHNAHAVAAVQFFAVPVAQPVAVPSYVNYGAFGGNMVGYTYQSQFQANYGNLARAATPACPPCPQCPPCPASANPTPAPAPQPAPQPQPAPAPAPAPQPVAPEAAPNPAPAPQPQPAPSTLLQQTCLKCHSGPMAKGGFSVDAPLTCEQKLAAIRALMTDDTAHRMPKDTVISDQDRGLLIQELSK
jgi:hypothetical protein